MSWSQIQDRSKVGVGLLVALMFLVLFAGIDSGPTTGRSAVLDHDPGRPEEDARVYLNGLGKVVGDHQAGWERFGAAIAKADAIGYDHAFAERLMEVHVVLDEYQQVYEGMDATQQGLRTLEPTGGWIDAHKGLDDAHAETLDAVALQSACLRTQEAGVCRQADVQTGNAAATVQQAVDRMPDPVVVGGNRLVDVVGPHAEPAAAASDEEPSLQESR